MLGSQQNEKQNKIRQLQLLKSYLGCRQCKSLAVDAYSLYEKNKLVCQPCLARKTGGSSSPISFLGQRKWFQKKWGVDISWWLETYQSLPMNADCAREWLKDREHLKFCQCLEVEARETYELFASSLREIEARLKECQCEVSPKVRVGSDDCAWCEKCKRVIGVASKKRVIKNRNDPRFWGVESKFKILCLRCIGRFYERMEEWQRKKWREYVRRGYS